MNDDITQEKNDIERKQTTQEQTISEVDDAAQSAEGMSSADSNILTEDTSEDRDATPPEGLNIQEEDITQ